MSKIKRITLILLLVITMMLSVSGMAAAPGEDATWEIIAPGIEYSKFRLADPNNVFVVRMDRINPNLILESTIADGTLAEGRETVSGMFNRYDQALNFWGGRSNPYDWGMRNQAVVAINGSYFDWGSGIPQGGQIQSGWYAKRFDDLGGRTGFAWKLDRSVFIGQCVFHRPEKQILFYPATENSQQISDVNRHRDSNQLILYTPQYNSNTGTSDAGVEVVVELTRPTMVLPLPAFASGMVRKINISKGNSPIPFNSVILSASGAQADILLANVQIGSEVQISQEITSYLDDCVTPDPNTNWTKTYSSLQGDYYFLQNGTIHDYYDDGAVARNPRTAIAYNDQYIYFIVVDGRDTQNSIGMSIHQLAMFSRDTLGAVYAVSQDGGGSSTLVINGVVVNNTYCNNYSCAWDYAVYIPLVRRAGQAGQRAQPIQPSIVRSPAGLERAVANGMMIVIAQPGIYSTLYSPGEQVSARYNIGLRLGPGTNYAEYTTISAGTHGIIASQTNNLDGVLAKSSYWWYVNFGGAYGWVPEEALTNQGMNNSRQDR